MRELTVSDKQLVLNGDAIFLRGTLECCVFPLTGYPPTDEAAWQRIFAICKAHGLNHMRFHSWCPPEAAFVAADKEGIFIQAEAPRANVDTNPLLDQFIQEESLRMADAYGNHPSFVLMSMGNELSVAEDVLSSLLAILQAHDSRRLYTASTGLGPQTSRDQFRVRHEGRGVGGSGTERDLREQVAQLSVPMISHEIGQWAVYPSLDEIEKYTGWLKPHNFELVRDDLASKHMQDQATAFTMATGRHSALLYKEEIEVLLRTPGLAGFQLLGLHDYPGTGTALVGLRDAFWDSKDAISPAKFRQFCWWLVTAWRVIRGPPLPSSTSSQCMQRSKFFSARLTGRLAGLPNLLPAIRN
ncbi:MAG: glycoside hydrolase family 2 TIM barrel-domain containing protein [Pirellulaceae bacterium]